MKQIKELKFEELTLEQKLGMSCAIFCADWKPEDIDYIEKLIKNRALGAIWVSPNSKGASEMLHRLKGAADYPILVFTDAEAGLGEYLIGRHYTVACRDSLEHAYTFGKITAINARRMGYNVVCNPIVDMNPKNLNGMCGATTRSLGDDKKRVTELAKAIARGAHDGGVLTVAKHYPGFSDSTNVDSHMAEVESHMSREALIDYNLYPYIELNKEGLIDGVMLAHARYTEVDPDYPFSVSGKGIQILRDYGFEGFAVTDALGMMGIVSKFGKFGSISLAVGNAGALALPFFPETEAIMTELKKAYDMGEIPDEVLDASVKRTLAAQHKVFTMQPKYDEITEEDEIKFKSLNYDTVFAKCDTGLTPAISREARHLFVVLTETDIDIRDTSKVSEDTMKTNWYRPYEIKKQLEELFPNSGITSINLFPSPDQNRRLMREVMGFNTLEPYDDVVFITFYQTLTYIGKECLSTRVLALFEALAVTDRISAVVHFGNPFVMEDLPHQHRIIIGQASPDGVKAGIEVLAGLNEARGKIISDVKFK
jgi:beta-glucosidase-like glycosyl hydrolase